jgi:NAD(P)-dependent dehydrogenase (short-subunit alcohol dehydrogenase family)
MNTTPVALIVGAGDAIGGAGFAAFSGAKMALRALARSMARELRPQGIHVAHSIIDGAIDTALIRNTFPERYALKECFTNSHTMLGRTSLICDLTWKSFEETCR